MLWRFRRELILLFLLFAGFLFFRGKTFLPVFGSGRSVVNYARSFASGSLSGENRRLLELLKLKAKYAPGKIIYARVVEISPWVFPSVIKLNKGSSAGVTPGMSVISKNGFLIGRVASVGPDYASGVTLFNPENKVSVKVVSTGELGILEGGSFPYLKMDFLPPGCRAVPGEMIETSSFTQLFPPGIPVGVLAGLHRSTNELVTKASVKPLFYYDDFEEVALVK